MTRWLTLVTGLGLASMLVISTARAEPPAAADGQATTAPGAAVLVDLNQASAAELEELPGIGPSRAQAILAFRVSHGGFTQLSQLMKIKGIGRAMLRRLRPFITIATPPANTAPPTHRAS